VASDEEVFGWNATRSYTTPLQCDATQ
jgi:hypothetical protein